MAADIYFMKSPLGGIVIDDAASRDQWDNLPVNVLCRGKLTQPRNVSHHRMFFALLKELYDTLPDNAFASFENFREQVLIGCGFVQEFKRFDKSTYYKAASLAFDQLDQTGFREFFDTKFLPFCDRHILPGISKDVKARFEEILQGNQAKLGNRIPHTQHRQAS